MTFAYSKTKHTRSENPPAYGDYRKFKPHLRTEFSGTCVYCRAPEALRLGHDEYGVDHYRPKSREQFKYLSCTYTNLFYCCPACNRRKGPYWPSPAKEASEFIPNPCDHTMFAHMAFRDGEVIAKTEAGRKACEILGLNQDRAIKWRQSVLKAIRALEAQVSTLRRQLATAESMLAAESLLPAGVVQEIQGSLSEATDSLAFWRGESQA